MTGFALAAGGAGIAVRGSRATVTTATPKVGEETPVSATDLYLKVSNNSPQVAIDPTDRRFMVIGSRIDAPFGCTLLVSGDGGKGWITAVPLPKLPEGADTCYGTEVAFDRQGRLYFLFVGLHGPGNTPMGAFLVTSDDRGRSFSIPRRVLEAGRYQVRLAIDRSMGSGGRVHLVWLEPGSAPSLGGLPTGRNPILSAHSDDGGSTFSAPVQVSDPARARVVAPAVSIGADHTMHVLYYDLGDDARDYMGLSGPPWDGTWSLVLSSSRDGGASFEPGSVVDASIVPPERVMLIFTMPPAALAASPDGHIHVAWTDARNEDWDVFVRSSSDGGRNWAEPIRLNDDAARNGSHQYMPALSVAPNGRVDTIFYDRRNNKENRGNDVYYTYSKDHGRTFAPNVRVTTRFFDTLVGPEYAVPSAEGLVEFGGRLGLASDNAGAFGAWTDTRNTILATPSQDIFGARLAFTERSASGVVMLVGGLVLVLGALLMGRGGRSVLKRRATA